MNLTELRQKKGELATQAQQVLDAAANDGRMDLRSEEESKFDAIHADIEKLSATITRLEKQAALGDGERRSEPVIQKTTHDNRVTKPSLGEGMRAWLVAGSSASTPEIREAATRAGFNPDGRNATIKLASQAMRSLSPADQEAWEKRAAMGTTSGAVGQYTVADEAMRALEVSLLAFGGMRSVATVIRTESGAALPIPTSDDTANKGAILAENTGASEVDITFGQIVLDAYKYSSKYVLVSVELLQDSSINVAEFIGKALGERIARITNDHFTTGTGSSQPNGIVTAAGAATAAASQTVVTYDELVNLLHSVDPAYRSGASWMFPDARLKQLKQLKILNYSGDTTGEPLWRPGLAMGVPDTILGYPYTINQSMATPATGTKSILFGDLSKYLIRDVRDVQLLRLDERFAEYHQVGFLAFSRHDGDLIDAGTDPVKYMAQA
jgi:HK97 family phage major capsid protein